MEVRQLPLHPGSRPFSINRQIRAALTMATRSTPHITGKASGRPAARDLVVVVVVVIIVVVIVVVVVVVVIVVVVVVVVIIIVVVVMVMIPTPVNLVPM